MGSPKLQELIDKSDNIVFFGGAGVSTASGIPDFRSSDGIFSKSYDYPPEVMLGYSFYREHKEEFYDFYKSNIIYLDAKPNEVHKKLAELEENGKLLAVITQNIDDLHQKAGSKNVLELHGSIYRNYCEKCKRNYDIGHIVNARGVPKCLDCSGDVRPDVVLYEEQLNGSVISKAVKAVESADLLIIGGTSLTVYPAAGFVDLFRGDSIVIINKTPTLKDNRADLVIDEDISYVFSGIKA